MMRKISSIDFKSSNTTSGKTVLMRVDYNVPVENDIVVDDFRILKSLPTIQYCLEQGSKVVLMSHLGRPNGVEEKVSLKNIASKVTEIIGVQVQFSEHCIGEKAEKSPKNQKKIISVMIMAKKSIFF